MKKFFVFSMLMIVIGFAGITRADDASWITVDGNTADWAPTGDWTMAATIQANLGVIDRNPNLQGEYVWKDCAEDVRTDLNGGNTVPSEDIIEFRVASDCNNLYFLATFNGDIPDSGAIPQIQIAIDTVPGQGNDWFAGNSDTKVGEAHQWEYLIQTRTASNAQPIVIGTDYKIIATGVSVVNGSVLEFSIPRSGLTLPQNIRFTVAVFQGAATRDANGVEGVADINGDITSDAIDAITNYTKPGVCGENTWSEVSDQVVDYSFDLFFDATTCQITPPMVISEVMYDSSDSPDLEYIKLTNVSNKDINVDNWKIGDEETVGGGEGMLMPPAAGISMPAGYTTILANNKTLFNDKFGADPNLVFGDMTNYTAWASGNIALGNSGDEILLLDPSDTVVDVVTYEGKTYPGVKASPGTPSNTDESIKRPDPYKDTNDCSTDFAVVQPTKVGDPSCMDENNMDICITNACIDYFDGTSVDGEVCCKQTCNAGNGNECCKSACNADGNCVTYPGRCEDQCGTTELKVECTCQGCGGADASGSCGCKTVTCNETTGCAASNCGGTDYYCNKVGDTYQWTTDVPTCDDGKTCTTDACNDSGVCSNTINTGYCLIDGTCYANQDTNPANVCQSCASTSSKTTWTNNTATCDDGKGCTEKDVCKDGTCQGTAKTCDDSNTCTDDSCDTATGECVHTNNTATCDDGKGCTEKDVCKDGTCQGTAKDCDDSNPCTDDSCNPDTGKCEHTNNTATCDDGKGCTEKDVCKDGTCQGTAKDCDDSNPCTDDSCNPDTGKCEHTNNTATCDDGKGCTEKDVCKDGTCQGTAKTCDDSNPCTDDSCNPDTGKCEHTNNTATCDDGNGCTEKDVCKDGTCQGTAKDCDDSNPCTDDSCNPDTGKCEHTNNTATCDDGNGCTEKDVCKDGTCQGTAKDCDDNNVCTKDSCDSSTGECVNSSVSDGAECDDNNACTINDSCVNGECKGGNEKDCSDLDTNCTTGVCDPSANGCVAQPKKDGTTCDDGNACTLNDACKAGKCQGETRDCDDGNACTVDFCDPQTGKCTNNAIDDGSSCGDCMVCATGKCIQDTSSNCTGNGGGGGGCSYSPSDKGNSNWLFLLALAGIAMMVLRRKKQR